MKDRAWLSLQSLCDCGGRQLTSHVVSARFVGTSHRRLKQWYWNGWSREVKILNTVVYEIWQPMVH